MSLHASEHVSVPFTPEEVHAAILQHRGVQQAADALGCSRNNLYKQFPGVIKAAQAELRDRALEGPVFVDLRLRMSEDMIAALDARAAERGVNRTTLALEAFKKLPKKLPAPIAADNGRPVPIRMPANVRRELQKTAGREADGVARALLAAFLARP